jgi:hypothetical protein
LSSNGGDESKLVDLKPVLDKLEEIRSLYNLSLKQEVASKEEDSHLTLEVIVLTACLSASPDISFFPVTTTAYTENSATCPGGQQQADPTFSTTGRQRSLPQ